MKLCLLNFQRHSSLSSHSSLVPTEVQAPPLELCYERPMTQAAIFTIPEELRQQITSYLNYDDAWSLKQTSHLFYRVVEIPTIKSFLHCPYGPSLGMLEDWAIIQMGYEACYFCKRFLPKEHFSRFQRHLTAARQHSDCFDYATWNPQKHYCIECGVKNHLYPGGKMIYVGFGDPDTSMKQSCLAGIAVPSWNTTH